MKTFRVLFKFSTVMNRAYPRKKFNHLQYNQCRAISYQNRKESSEKEAFHSVVSEVIESIAGHPKAAEIPELEGWIKKLFTHNLTGGKGARGQTVVTTYEMLETPEKVTDESMRLARILGWCVEMSYLVIIDDMMDGATTRRGQPCWHLMPGVGTGCAMNDAIIVCNGMFYVLKKNFGEKESYVHMLDAINETLLYSSFGQFLDYKSTQNTTRDYSLFTQETHHAIIRNKTAYYTYDLPIYLGLLLADFKMDQKLRMEVQGLCLQLGTLFQIQAMLSTGFGQHLDIKRPGKYGLFTLERYHSTIKLKCSFYTFDLPVYLGLLLADYKVDDQTSHQMQEISMDMGLLFQIQDDYIDCYGDESLTGKAGTDIQEGKCSWLAVSALQRCNEPQRIVFNCCYGSKEPAHIERIKRLYDQLELPELYKQVERRYFDEILEKIRVLPKKELRKLFHKMLETTFQRKK